MTYLKDIVSFLEAKKNGPDIKKVDFDGFIIYQGRNADSNDHLTFEIANKNDWWLHAKEYPGSHVVIVNKNQIPDNRIIYRAAEMAAKNCQAAKQGMKDIEVICCKRQFVTKRKGMKPGEVAVDEKNTEIIKVKL